MRRQPKPSEESRAKSRTRVYAFIRERGARGATDYETQQATGIGPQTQTPARLELERGGIVQDSGKTRKTPSGRPAIVWVVCKEV